MTSFLNVNPSEQPKTRLPEKATDYLLLASITGQWATEQSPSATEPARWPASQLRREQATWLAQ
ncbi:MAG: hypothetical protein EOO61_17525 [Hymenobacter sp.]|nr:MAG: hypothetical protein EOO61_17525 [Hymenobacter sp.]